MYDIFPFRIPILTTAFYGQLNELDIVSKSSVNVILLQVTISFR